MVRAKFQVTSHKTNCWYPGQVEIGLSAIYDPTIPEDQQYAKATPTGSITMVVDNPAAIAALPLGKKFYVDFTPVEEPATV